ncbi:DUF262 domain-containing protein [Mesorhizobium sp. M1060]|uniref:DUF262 domain-containing protein n=1 Tax=unclassified Mesorhizobium TaxID=325217 RepID=UPI00333C5B4C
MDSATFALLISTLPAVTVQPLGVISPPFRERLSIGEVNISMNSDLPTDVEKDDIEGLDPGAEASRGDYPLEDVMVRTETRSAREVVDRISKDRYIMDPDFQRAFVWDVEKQSKLIESCVMRIPLPVFYVAEAPDGRIIVVDGLQRLTTFHRFLGNEFKLSGLPNDSAGRPHFLEGKYFDDLEARLQERIEDTQLVLYILDRKAPEAARLDIFDRVNSGAPLTRQQMRNALYSGKATQWLRDQAASSEFRAVNAGSLKSKTMRDREAINRFAAFYLLGHEAYMSGEMDEFMARALVKMNASPEQQLEQLQNVFRHSMKWNFSMFRFQAFRKSLKENNPNAWRTPLNISMFDVFSVIFANIDEATFQTRGDGIKASVIELMNEESFLLSISYSTNSGNQVQSRFRIAIRALGEYME